MFSTFQVVVVIGTVLLLTLTGVHIAVALGTTAVLGAFLMVGDWGVVFNFISSTAYEALRDYVFAVIPLFLLMGGFLAQSGAARDIFTLINKGLAFLPGRLGLATVGANALFAFVTGVSIAAAAAFSRIAYPEMRRAGYDKGFSAGCIAGSSCLGMLIPPSVLMIVWGVLTEQSIGQLFLAGVGPGLLLALLFCVYIVFTAVTKPHIVGAGPGTIQPMQTAEPKQESTSEQLDESLGRAIVGTVLVLGLVAFILGGIWMGAFTPTEGAGVGAASALVVAIIRGVRFSEIREVVLQVGRTSAPLLLLLFCAQLYSRVLSMTGITGAIQTIFVDSGLDLWAIILIMVAIWFVLGCLIDSISIILITVPVFAPVAHAAGMDPIAFAMIGILAIESGLLTPPFGILVFTVKASLPPNEITVGQIFRYSIPYWLCLLIVVITIWFIPSIATWLPEYVFSNK
ncbi:MAG: TRAP transporter large permease [Betaproteobacteria bacterium]|nr:TRAP transporter large permease [Betaproteobacteria bacterium]